MKIAALLGRSKGRDFYDLMFLSSFTKPDYQFLKERCGIANGEELKSALKAMLDKTDLNHKRRDFEHLVIKEHQADTIQLFPNIISALCE